MAIQSDTRGFLLGERRIKEIQDGIVQTKDNTKEILEVLKSSLDDLRRDLTKSQTHSTNVIGSLNRSGRSQSSSKNNEKIIRQSVDSSGKAVEATDRALETIKNIQNDIKVKNRLPNKKTSTVSSANERAKDSMGRDSLGRFTGSGTTKFGALSENLRGNLPDASGVDPTLDAIKEVSEIVSPVGRIFRGMGARAISLFRGRTKRRRSDEVLPQEQVEANNEQERSGKQRNKLLQRLINAVMSSSGSGSGFGGIFGRLIRGGGGRGLLKGIFRKIPFLGAILGGGALAMNWGKLSSGGKGKGIGEIIGTVVGGALGSFLGIGGTIAGGTLGNYLGGIFGEKVGEWTNKLKDTDFGKLFKSAIESIWETGKKALTPFTLPFKSIMWAGDKIASAFGSGSSNTINSSGSGYVGTPTIAGKLSQDKIDSIRRVAKNIGLEPNDLAQIISFETSGTFNPNARNPKSSGTGLIQKMGDGATKRGKYNDGKYWGMTRDQYGALSFDEQMKYVEKYYRERGFDGKSKRSLADGYSAVAGWGYKKGTEAYRLNSKWDADGNGVIDKGEAIQAPAFKAHRKNYIPEEPNIQSAKGVPYRAEIIKSNQSKQTKPIAVPVIKADFSKTSSSINKKSSNAPSDPNISQVVSDRSLAHVFSGSLGFDRYSA
ncbi:hypothetical protein KTH44_16155 [Acinetobacter bereziniae]|uniref:hypothetical protein n=1 Tax=Acinetobacter bereziniae TaxID=106648 RepID=UPI0021CDB276|nr:hypothetical protein [Acinetobacter bereziniae]MCU4320651.1 hypothetical protein [Acinetobacter bereziniae]